VILGFRIGSGAVFAGYIRDLAAARERRAGGNRANAECSPRKTWQGMQNEELLSVKSAKSVV
jgi:hypothetical protein